MLPLLVAVALAVPFLRHRHHAPPKPAPAIVAPPAPAAEPAPPVVKIANPAQQELEQTDP